MSDHCSDTLILPITPETRVPVSERATVVAAVRRALMSLDRDGNGAVSFLFSGHAEDGAPARSGQHRHVYLFADDADGDGKLDRIGIVAPWRVDRSWVPSSEERARFQRVAGCLSSVKAGRAGVLALGRGLSFVADDPMILPATAWISRTSYRPTRHAKKKTELKQMIAEDCLRECERRGLPRPSAEVLTYSANAAGVTAHIRLDFQVAVEGPLLLGTDAHAGGGLFVAVG